MGATLEIAGLGLRFGGLVALDGIDLALAPGAVLGLAGPNGSGKSSLVNVLTGHYAATGRILLDGRPIDGLAPHERARLGIARTFQAPRLYRRLSVAENLRAGRHAARPLWQNAAARRREHDEILGTLALFGLDGRAEDFPDRLTPFELRLLELARVHLVRPRLLLLDEPAAGATTAEVARLRRVMADHLLPGRSVILIEHRLDLMAALCGRIAVLQAGRKLAEGPPNRVLALPAVRALLLGEGADAELAGLVAGYAGNRVIEQGDLTVAPGEAILLTGPNGAGKSTFIRTVAGLQPPLAGRILWQGRDVTRLPFHARDGIALVPEGRILAPRLTVAETLALGAGAVPGRELRRRRDAVLDRLPLLADRIGQSAGTLSGGEAQMLSLGRALMADPQLLLLDEPTLGLSPAAAKAALATLGALRAEGLAMIVSDQDARAAAVLADRILAVIDRRLTESPPIIQNSQRREHIQ